MRCGPVLVMAAVAVLVGAGCGGDEETVGASRWAAEVCGEVNAAIGDLESAVAVIDELPTEVAADAPLGAQADDLRAAFAALPAFVERYTEVVERMPPPDTPDGAAFRQELLEDLAEAGATFARAAVAAEAIDDGTTVADFFTGAQVFARFPEAFAASDLTYDDPPPELEEAMAAEPSCEEARRRLG